jgi:transcription elongation factor Elf1
MTTNYRCIECSHPTPQIYVEYGKGNIRLMQCENCGKFCDKYVEFDLTILFIDMILLKATAYRHLVYNRIQYDQYGMNVLNF